jgi:hypothetical protein
VGHLTAAGDDDSSHSRELENEAFSPPCDQTASDSDDNIDYGGENAQQRAKHFKLWAREQSGLGSSISNISSLPALPPTEMQEKLPHLKNQHESPTLPPMDNKPPRVPLSLWPSR